jgi:hypothetical protein
MGQTISEISSWVLAGLGGYYLVSLLMRKWRETAARKQDEELEKALSSIANEINRDSPKRLDEWTQFTGAVAGPGKTFTYKYTASVPEGTDIAAFKGRLDAHISHSWDTDRDNNPIEFYEMGVEICYDYKDAEGRSLFVIRRKKQ